MEDGSLQQVSLYPPTNHPNLLLLLLQRLLAGGFPKRREARAKALMGSNVPGNVFGVHAMLFLPYKEDKSEIQVTAKK